MKKIVNWIKQNKKNAAVAATACFVGALLVCGLSIAYFTSRDTVTNRHTAKELSIRLFEPEWLSTGEEMAAKLEPGMQIPKDPYVYNDSDANLYVRMQIILYVQNNNGDYEQMIVIGPAGAYDDTSGTSSGDSSGTPSGDSSGASSAAVSAECAAIYDAIVSSLYCMNVEGGGSSDVTGDVGKALLEEVGGTVVSNNDMFAFEDGWFYYKNEDASYKVLAPGESTYNLFDYIKVPILKTEYNGLFDKPFRIEVVAQAISATYAENEVIGAFEVDYTEATSDNTE